MPSEHLYFTICLISLFGRSLSNVVAIFGDNFNSNKCFSKLAHKLFAGCASHLFNLAVRNIILCEMVSVDAVKKIMKNLSNFIPSAKWQHHTHLRAKCHNVTRWSSTYKILKRFQKMRLFLSKLEMD